MSLLFFARNDVFCDILQYRSTKYEIDLFYIIKRVYKNEVKTCEKFLMQFITPSDDVIRHPCVWTVIMDISRPMKMQNRTSLSCQ